MHVATAKTAGLVGVAMLIAAGAGGVTAPGSSAAHGDVTLTAGLGDGVALIMGPGGSPAPGDAYMATIDRLYLHPLGFTGQTVAVTHSWEDLFGNWDYRVEHEADSLIAAINQQLASGDYGPDNPLVIVGYSESAVAAGQAMSQLHADGIPSDDLHFVLIGDSASAQGGFLNSVLASLPASLRDFAQQLLTWFGLGDLLGATTPTGLYPTDEYTIPGDMWGDWSSVSSVQDALNGFVLHLAYIGLTPDQLGGAFLSGTEGMTDFYTIPALDIDPLSAFWNALVNMGSIPEWLAGLFS